MKTVSIGDTHGLAAAEIVMEIADKYDKLIFAGDYVDSFFIDNVSIVKNLLDIIELKKRYPDKIILLWGNHDIQYLFDDEYFCTGFRPEMQHVLHQIFLSNQNLFQFSFQHGAYLWTHAGVHAGWFEYRFSPFLDRHKEIVSVSELLNMAFGERYKALFDIGRSRGGNQNVGGPLWCDRTELTSKPLKGLNQIVGHSRVKNIQNIIKYDNEIVFIDILENVGEVNASSFFYKEV
jgi:hypothetical protein